MTREVMVKRKFSAYTSVDFKHSELQTAVECMLVSINFDTEIMILKPFPKDNPFEQDEFPAHISHCEFSRHKLKIV